MEFLLHLGLLAAGVVWLVWLLAAPRECVVITAALVTGYVGSEAGFLGTVAGLIGGAIAGGLFLWAWRGVRAAWRWVMQPHHDEGRTTGPPTPRPALVRQSPPPSGGRP